MQIAQESRRVFRVAACHDSWKVPESQMTGDETQLESGKIGREAESDRT